MPSPTTTRSGKEIKNRKVISKRRANQGAITNKKRAATLGQAPKNKLRAKRLAAGEAVRSKLSDEKKARIASGTTKSRARKASQSTNTTGGMASTGGNKKVMAKKKAKAGEITNKKRANKLGQTPKNKLRAAKQKAASGQSNNRLRARKLQGKKTKTRG